MSRSRKKHAIYKGSGSSWVKKAKKFSNRRIRNVKYWIPDGKWFRKIYPQWDIHDFVYHMDFKPYVSHMWGMEPRLIEPDPKWKIYGK